MGEHLYWIPLAPLLGALLNLLVWRVLFRVGFKDEPPKWLTTFTAVGSVAAAFVLVLVSAWDLRDQVGIGQQLYTWIQAGDFSVELAFSFDRLSAVMCLLITFVGLLIHIYSTGYMAHEPRYATYFGYLNLFTGAMLILVLGDNLLVMFIGWEGVGLCSYLLIGFWFTEEANAYAGRKAFVVNRIGDFAFLLGIFLIYWVAGTVEFAEINANAALFEESSLGGERVALFACVLLFIGACGKSAQIPLYVWLPDAMAGPTPVSALIHAATMVTAGVYMIARLSFLFATSTTAMAIVAGVGALTALWAAIIAFAQTDFKKVLAYSTVSQLGFMFVGVGVGAWSAGIFHLLTHGFFKAGLFLAAGSVMHAMSGSGDIRIMGGLRKQMPLTHIAFVCYWLAICGIPIFAGFWSKDEILAGAFIAEHEGWWPLYGKLLWVVLSAAAVGTAFYMSRLYFLVFWGENRADAETQKHIHESPRSMTVPLLVLAAFTCVLGAIGLPHDFHLPYQLGTWLEPVIDAEALDHPSGAIVWILMAVATVLALVGIFGAAALYKRGPSETIERMTAGGLGARVYRAVRDKLYVDELYDAIVVRPFKAVSQFLFDIVDRFVIDFVFVSGSAFVVDLFGRMARWFQNGQVQRYMAAVLVGAAVVVFFATRAVAEFEYRPAGPSAMVFRAASASGPGSQGAEVTWDFDGDGEVDATDREVRWEFPEPGTYRVTMWLTDGAFGRTGKVTHDVVVNGGAEGGGR